MVSIIWQNLWESMNNLESKPEIIDIDYVGYWGKCYLVKYKGFSNVLLKEEIDDWIKEVEALNIN
jgi:hypothetical protein